MVSATAADVAAAAVVVTGAWIWPAIRRQSSHRRAIGVDQRSAVLTIADLGDDGALRCAGSGYGAASDGCDGDEGSPHDCWSGASDGKDGRVLIKTCRKDLEARLWSRNVEGRAVECEWRADKSVWSDCSWRGRRNRTQSRLPATF